MIFKINERISIDIRDPLLVSNEVLEESKKELLTRKNKKHIPEENILSSIIFERVCEEKGWGTRVPRALDFFSGVDLIDNKDTEFEIRIQIKTYTKHAQFLYGNFDKSSGAYLELVEIYQPRHRSSKEPVDEQLVKELLSKCIMCDFCFHGQYFDDDLQCIKWKIIISKQDVIDNFDLIQYIGGELNQIMIDSEIIKRIKKKYGEQ